MAGWYDGGSWEGRKEQRLVGWREGGRKGWLVGYREEVMVSWLIGGRELGSEGRIIGWLVG